MNNLRIRKSRIPVELQQLKNSQQVHGITCSTLAATPEDFSCLEALIPGPVGSPYEGGIFKLTIRFGEQYPFRPPTFKFITPIYHPNIDNSGKICLDLLQMPPTGSYNPAITLESMLLSVQLLLANPNPDDPLQGEAADLYKSNQEMFNNKVKELVKKSCKRESDVFGKSTDNPDFNSKQDSKRKKLKLN